MPYEKNYHLTKLEFLALKWVVTEISRSTCSINPSW